MQNEDDMKKKREKEMDADDSEDEHSRQKRSNRFRLARYLPLNDEDSRIERSQAARCRVR